MIGAVAAKECTSCHELKPLSEFHAMRASKKDGLTYYCKVCISAKNKARLAAFSPEKDRARRAKMHEWHEAHQTERAEYNRSRYAANRETEQAAAIARYYADVEHSRARARHYSKTHPEGARRRRGQRQAREKAAFIEVVDFGDICERDGWICQECRQPVDPNAPKGPMQPSMDHIIPYSRGGLHVRANVQLTHWICNVRKGSRMP